MTSKTTKTPLPLTLSETRGVLIVAPGERLDPAAALEAESKILERIEAGARRVVIDFACTAYISSAGLRMILRALKSLKEVQGWLVLCNANSDVRKVLEISGFLGMTSCHDTRDEAVAALTLAESPQEPSPPAPR